MNAQRVTGIVYSGYSAIFLARVLRADGTPLKQADLASAKYSILTSSGAAVTGHTAVSVAVASLMYDTLQTTDPHWTEDETGYNFRWQLDVSANQAFSASGLYEVRFELTPVSGQKIPVWFQPQAI